MQARYGVIYKFVLLAVILFNNGTLFAIAETKGKATLSHLDCQIKMAEIWHGPIIDQD
jgi:hypothetical protein